MGFPPFSLLKSAASMKAIIPNVSQWPNGTLPVSKKLTISASRGLHPAYYPGFITSFPISPCQPNRI